MLKLSFFLLTISSFHAQAGRAYPLFPDALLTPGSLCEDPVSYRYPESIPYCERGMNSFMKETIFIAYRKLGYSLSGDRSQYKVDHFIPLCAGGSNGPENLWPQYYTLSKRTDALEKLGCEVLALGKISQNELIHLIKKAKLDTKEVPAITRILRSLKR